ncbi:MAG: hypothetical protein ACJAR9_000571 [Celeribacter sp.]|jgi:hypothetical protein
MTDVENDDTAHAAQKDAAARALARLSCPYCGSVMSVHQRHHPGHCGAPACLTAQIVKAARDREEQRQQDYAERQGAARAGAREKMQRAAQMLDCADDELVVAVVPQQDVRMETLPQGRLDAFQAHLSKVVGDAFRVPSDENVLSNYAQNTRDEPSIVRAGCATCQGFCCTRGGGDNHAFITRQSIYYILQQDPALTPDDVVSHFLEALPEKSVEGGCVFQGPVGCTLTRDWRAGLCNTFHCHDLHAMHDVTGGRTDVPLVIVGIEDDTVGQVSVFDLNQGWRRVD